MTVELILREWFIIITGHPMLKYGPYTFDEAIERLLLVVKEVDTYCYSITTRPPILPKGEEFQLME